MVRLHSEENMIFFLKNKRRYDSVILPWRERQSFFKVVELYQIPRLRSKSFFLQAMAAGESLQFILTCRWNRLSRLRYCTLQYVTVWSFRLKGIFQPAIESGFKTHGILGILYKEYYQSFEIVTVILANADSVKHQLRRLCNSEFSLGNLWHSWLILALGQREGHPTRKFWCVIFLTSWPRTRMPRGLALQLEARS